MRLPIAQAHPTKVVFTIITLHMIATAILLDTNVAFGTIFCVRRNIVGRFAIVRALGQPFLYHMTVGGGVVVGATAEAKCRFAVVANGAFG
jgi:hypothetical protein